MKRCSECHFTFADNEQVCDFDGTPLTEIPDRNREPGPRATPLRRLLRSHGLIVALTLVGLVLSALLFGYFDALSREAAGNPQEEQSTASIGPIALGVSAETAQPAPKPRRISMERRISANGKPELAMHAKWERRESRQRATRRQSRTAKILLAAIRDRSKRNALASSVAGNRNHRYHPAASPSRTSVAAAGRDSYANTDALSHHKKDSKFVAVLKTTGRILKWPFQF